MLKPQDLLSLSQAALNYANAVGHTAGCKEALRDGYHAWRIVTGHQDTVLIKGDANWNAMMKATAETYQQLRNAKSREWRAKQKLLTLAKRWEDM